jgi:hypothetical protein
MKQEKGLGKEIKIDLYNFIAMSVRNGVASDTEGDPIKLSIEEAMQENLFDLENVVSEQHCSPDADGDERAEEALSNLQNVVDGITEKYGINDVNVDGFTSGSNAFDESRWQDRLCSSGRCDCCEEDD